MELQRSTRPRNNHNRSNSRYGRLCIRELFAQRGIAMTVTDRELDQLIAERQVRLMLLGPQQRPICEASPSPLHQIFVRDIEASIRAAADSDEGCACEHIADAYIRLPDSSLVRPDIAIFCAPIPRQREAYAAVPAAVIEIVSPNYEAK